MRIIFCCEPFNPQVVDPAYEAELQAVQNLGIVFDLIDFEQLVHEQNPNGAVRRVRTCEQPEIAVYRGWMLRPADYAALYTALHAKNITLINTPAQYQHCHYLPDSYAVIARHTPKSVWLKYDADFSIEQVLAQIAQFGNAPLIIKDYVKSRKHDWHEACFIPDASDHAHVERVVSRFLALQGADLNEGVVLREFVEFQPIGVHPKSQMPLTKEFRWFVLDGHLLISANYWEMGEYDQDRAVEAEFSSIMQRVQSRFYSMDIAQRTDGTWQIVELGDGQVAGLPETLNIEQFYRGLEVGVRD